MSLRKNFYLGRWCHRLIAFDNSGRSMFNVVIECFKIGKKPFTGFHHSIHVAQEYNLVSETEAASAPWLSFAFKRVSFSTLWRDPNLILFTMEAKTSNHHVIVRVTNIMASLLRVWTLLRQLHVLAWHLFRWWDEKGQRITRIHNIAGLLPLRSGTENFKHLYMLATMPYSLFIYLPSRSYSIYMLSLQFLLFFLKKKNIEE